MAPFAGRCAHGACLLGMAISLYVDRARVPLVGAFCGDVGLGTMVWSHLQLLPWMQAGMVAGSLLGLPAAMLTGAMSPKRAIGDFGCRLGFGLVSMWSCCWLLGGMTKSSGMTIIAADGLGMLGGTAIAALAIRFGTRHLYTGTSRQANGASSPHWAVTA